MMQSLDLMPSTRYLLSAIRRGDVNLAVYELDPKLCEAVLVEIAAPHVACIREPRNRLLQYQWFLRELAAVLVNRQGWDLAFELELLLRRWEGFKLIPRVLQMLLRESCRRLALPREAANVGAQASDAG
ncbi:hypothetical protein JXB37_05870 [candidate division WOR-3 bacterium]|nr:hypothetical protein [candidate division WOR-3 bacterium]